MPTARPVGEQLRTNDRDSIQSSRRGKGPIDGKTNKFLRKAIDDWRLVASTESELRKEMLEDLRFRSSDQWPDNVQKDRVIDARPTLTINRLPQFIRQVTNSQRTARPSIEIHPVNDDSDVDTAQVLQGVVRHIERNSDADVAYTTAGEHQATMGRGYWRVVTDFVTDQGGIGRDGELTPALFEQEIKIKRIRNPFAVYMDPTAMEADASDARFCLITEDVPKNEYKRRFPDSNVASLADFVSAGNTIPDWFPEDCIRIAEYYYIDEETFVAVQLSDGRVFRKKELPMTNRSEDGKFTKPTVDFETLTIQSLGPSAANVLEADGSMPEDAPLVTIVNEREVTERVVKWALINAMEVLEGNDAKTSGAEVDGMYIPVVQVVGDEIDLNGEVDYRGIVRDARDPQRMYNYWVSAETEAIALAPKAPFVAAEGQLEGHEKTWENANRRNFAYLYYKPTSLNGVPVPPPQRQALDTPISAIVQATAQADNDLKAVTGFFDPSLGNLSSGERSGKAIVALQKQGEMANSNYLDNLARAIRFTGRILVDLIPYIYDTPRVMRITGNDQKERSVIIGSQVPEDAQVPAGFEKIYDLSVGRYDVATSVGPSWQTQRQEASASLVEFTNAFPAVFPVIADLIASNMDWPQAKETSERLKAWAISQGAIPPDEGGLNTLPPEAQALVQGLQQQLGQAKQVAEGLVKEKALEETKHKFELAKQSAELAAKGRIEANKQAAETARAAAKIQADSGLQVLQAELARLGKVADTRHQELMTWVQAASQRAPQPSAPPAPGGPRGNGGAPGGAPGGGAPA